MRWAEMKLTVYSTMTLFSIVLLLLAFRLSHEARMPEAITSIVLFAVGCGLLMFGILTYVLREDPDVWR